MLVIGVDTGGTFTDFIYKTPDGWRVLKLLSTPDDPSRAVLQGLTSIGGDGSRQVVHGSTVATNAILERKGVRTAMIANTGFEDVLEIGRQNRLDLYDLRYRKPAPIIPPQLRFGAAGRVDAAGQVVEPLNPDGLREIVDELRVMDVESVAVCLLFSFLDPSHERMVRDALAPLGVPVSVSHEILAEFREFERASTTAVNAYVSPRMDRYIQNIQQGLAGDPLRIMQSNGGAISADTARAESVRTILSGPAGGVSGAVDIAQAAGFERIITFDMGGTSTDVCLVDQEPPLTLESAIEGYPVKAPMIDIHTVGAGGGSIADLDPGGALKVGPESAGAEPGPVCYGHGGRLTVTDAHLALGRLSAEHFLGGDMLLDRDRLEAMLGDLAKRAGMAPLELAEGVLAVADANMERAIRVISVERGFDPREFTMVAFGGAGGLHACSLARLLSIPRVLVPRNPGILSAMGMVLADVIKDFSRTVMLDAEALDHAELRALFGDLELKAYNEMAEEGFAPESLGLELFLDMRYAGQSFEIITPFAPDVREAFEALHEQAYGYRQQAGVEIVNLRLRARGAPVRPELAPAGELTDVVDPAAELGRAPAVFAGQAVDAQLLDRSRLRPGNRLAGPAIVTEYTSTIVIPPDVAGEVDAYANLVLEIAS
jgi:N-methylhydantoinase A